ncbi:MAG: hypothetical protein J7J94_03510 [Thaumarchaeota archaeon]|nr:hypothetical protein [Nitrososphaerota archaeon]
MSLQVLGWAGNALRIKGVLAPARVSRNNRLYLPEELRKMAEEVDGKEIPVYWEHVSAGNAVGKAKVFWDDVKKALRYEAEIFDEAAAEKIRSGLVKHVSLGADYERIDLVDDVIVPRDLHLREISLVAVPGIPEANIEIAESIKLRAVERAVRAHETLKAPVTKPWDAEKAVESLRKWASADRSGAKETIDWAKYRLGFAWYDEDDPESFGSYKLPHHEVVNGNLYVVWRGVAAAMAALFGARGGVNIPEENREGVYRHLAAHYRQFDKQPPSYEKLSELSRLEEPLRSFKLLEYVGLIDEAYADLKKIVEEIAEEKHAKYSRPRVDEPVEAMAHENKDEKVVVEKLDQEPRSFSELCRQVGRRIAESVKLKAREAVTGASDQPVTHSMPLFRVPAGAPIGLRSFGEVVALERGAKTATLPIINSITFSELTPGSEPTEATQTITFAEVTPVEYGAIQSFTYVDAERMTEDLGAVVARCFAEAAQLSSDDVILQELDSSAGAAVTPGGKAEGELTSSDTFTSDLILSALTQLRNNNVGFAPGDLVLVLHPKQYEDLLKEDYVKTAMQFGTFDPQTGVIARLFGVDIFVSPRVKTGTGSDATTYHAVLFKKRDAFVMAISRDLLIETFRDVKARKVYVAGSHCIAAKVKWDKAVVKIITA